MCPSFKNDQHYTFGDMRYFSKQIFLLIVEPIFVPGKITLYTVYLYTILLQCLDILLDIYLTYKQRYENFL